ncbi:hypothetical protein B9T20_06615 [Wohlfahrtiimonas sp. G9077]|nr:YceI family protein [Wohlfahrtiimonas sp. G9077]OYQ73385.1 hypothetical protein B9T20_06615 [Wohlfahrtiimonas sp. G9077]
MTKTLFTLGALLCLTPSLATHYQLEPEHTNARFYIDHFQTSTNHGGFYGLTGHVTYDPDHEVGSVTVIIPIKNLKSGSDAFDQHLKNSDLFDAAKYPEMRFTSTQWQWQNHQPTHITGDLTLLGQTHPVTLTVERFNCYHSPIWQTQVCGGDFSAEIDRTQWGMDFFVDKGMSKTVNIAIQAEAVKE